MLTESNVQDATRKVVRKRAAFGDISNTISAAPVSAKHAHAPAKGLKTAGKPSVDEVIVLDQTPAKSWVDRLPVHDRGDVSDPRFVSEYVNQIFEKMRQIESQNSPIVGDYMSTCQTDLTERMRGVLVDWLVEVHWKFKLYPETLFLTVNLLDRFLSVKPNIPRNQLQLVGITCLLIAAKYEDIYAPEIKDIVHICDKTYKKEEILSMEVLILNTLCFKITTPSALLFLLRMAKIARCDERQFYLAQYCLELAVADYQLWTNYSSSQLAAATLFLSSKLLRKSPAWSQALQDMSGYTEQQLKPIAKEICITLQATNEPSPASQESSSAPANKSSATPSAIVTATRAIKKKFSQPKYHSVAKLVL
jgi:G2/mitotic-specific cyclin-B, other